MKENKGLSASLPGGLNFGVPGKDGATFTPSLDDEGNLSWSNNKGLQNPETKNIRGPQGPAGEVSDEQVATVANAWLAKNAASLRGERGFSADYSINPWPNPLEAYRDNSDALVIPFGTVADRASLNGNTGVVTPQTNYAHTWKATVRAGEEIEIFYSTYAFYDSDDVFISGGSGNTSEWITVTIPDNAKYIRLYRATMSTSDMTADYTKPAAYYKSANQYGYLIPNPRSIISKIYDPAYAHLNVVFSGDSNTYGAGLDDTAKSWAGLIATKLQTIWGDGAHIKTAYPSLMPGNVKCACSKRVVGGPGSAGSWLEFDFNGMELKCYVSYKGTDCNYTYDVYVNDELYETIAFTYTENPVLTFPDYSRKRIKFVPASDMEMEAINMSFEWTRSMEFTNVGLSGANFMTMPTTGIEDCDMFIYLLGTNQRGGLHNNQFEHYGVLNTLKDYKDKIIAILPPPRGGDETMPNGGTYDPAVNEWTSEAYINASIVEQYNRLGITYVDISAEMAMESARHYKTMLQSDLLHFSEEGHKILANVISAKLGIPTYYKLEAVT